MIGGWLPGKGRRSSTIGALLLGVYEATASLRYVGRVGTGFSDEGAERLQALLEPLRQESSPFSAGERPPREAVVRRAASSSPRWTSREWTSAGNIRHPSYKGLREDKPRRAGRARGHAPAPQQRLARRPRARADLRGRRGRDAHDRLEIRRARQTALVGGRELKLSNLGKVLYPETGFTKGRADRLLRRDRAGRCSHTSGRRADVTRWPDGVEGKSFFQKQSPAHRPEWVRDRHAAQRAARRSTTRSPTTCRRSSGWRTSRRSSCTRRSRSPRPRPPDARWSSTSTPGERHGRARLRPPGAATCRACSRTCGLASFVEDVGLEGPAGVRAAERRGRRLRAHEDRSRRPSPSCSSRPSPSASSRA